jgi:hypothetical protein
MRGILLIIVLELGLGLFGISVGMTGCATKQPVVAAIPGETNALDGQVYRGLRDVQAVIDTYKAKVADGSFHPSAAMTTGMADLTQAYNTTHSLWTIYHASASTAQSSTGQALQTNYDSVQAKYATALSTGAPIPPLATIGAK